MHHINVLRLLPPGTAIAALNNPKVLNTLTEATLSGIAEGEIIARSGVNERVAREVVSALANTGYRLAHTETGPKQDLAVTEVYVRNKARGRVAFGRH